MAKKTDETKKVKAKSKKEPAKVKTPAKKKAAPKERQKTVTSNEREKP